VRIGGAVAQIGVLTQTDEPVEVPLILRKQVRVQGIYVGSRADFDALNRALEQTRIEPVVDREVAFAELPEAFRMMEAASHFGKIVVRMR
jgi:D-arabinose 1-dehydrogenase-like Zn-dependent alcohol dehydrogenase